MDKILIFNNDTDRREVYYRGESKPMPYNTKSEDDTLGDERKADAIIIYGVLTKILFLLTIFLL